jgi:hypothetical protein
LHDHTHEDEAKPFAETSRQSLAQKIWRNKWTWAVGRTWRHHFANITILIALLIWASRKPPASILEKMVVNLGPWTQEIIGDLFALLVTLPGYLTSFYLIACVTIHAIIQAMDKMGKVADYFGADNLKRFLDHAVREDTERRIVLDLTPQGGLPPVWMLFLFWPLMAYQWALAGVFAALAICLPGSHRFRNGVDRVDEA